MTSFARLFVAVLLGAHCVAGSAAGQTPAASEFQVNAYTSSFQTAPSVALDGDAGFVVIWGSYGSADSDDDVQSIQGQRYDADGSVVGSQFQVNTYTTSVQSEPSVAVDTNGSFVVVWTSDGSAGSDAEDESIQGQRYDVNGSPLGGEFQVNTYTTMAQLDPAVAVHASGDFVVVWSSAGSAGDDDFNYSVQGQRYDASGSSLGGEFQVNTYTPLDQRRPAVAVEADGDFVVVWQSFGSSDTDLDGFSIQGQRYDASGNTVGDEFQVNTYTTSTQAGAAVAIDADGDFVVVWESFGGNGDPGNFSVQGQRYDASSGSVGGQFRVNSSTALQQRRPAVAVGADGAFVVAWDSLVSTGGDSSAYSLQAQRYDASGSAVGTEFQVNTFTTTNQVFPAVAAVTDEDFVVVWRSDGSVCNDGSSASIQGQRYDSALPGPGFILNPAEHASRLDIFADGDDEAPFITDALCPTGTFFSRSHQVSELASESEGRYGFSRRTLLIEFDHVRDSIGFAQTGASPMYFGVGADDFYTLEGVYTAVDAEGRRISQGARLRDVTDGVTLFDGIQESQATPNESFTVGRMGGDFANTLEGSRTGTLLAGHEYRLEYFAFIDAEPPATLPATASGYFRLTLGAPPEFVPALGSPGLLALVTLMMAAGSVVLRRPLRRASRSSAGVQEARTTR